MGKKKGITATATKKYEKKLDERNPCHQSIG